MRSFIAIADVLPEATLGQHEAAVYYCDRLFSLLLKHKERILPHLPNGVRSEPAEPILAEVFDSAARGLRGLQKE